MPVPLIAAGVAAVGSIGGALISSGSQKSAANQAAAAQQAATDSQLQLGRENIAFQQGIYDKNTALLNPFVQRGNVAGNQINALLGLGGTQPVPTSAAQTGTQTPATGPAQTTGVVSQTPVAGGANTIFGRKTIGFNPETGATDFTMPSTAWYAQPAQQAATAPTTPATTAVGGTTPAATGQTAQQAASAAFNQFAHSAGIDFQLQQGTNALQNSAAARGMLQSGATLKALQNYGQNTALNNYFMPYLGLLQGQQATGAQSGAAIAGVGSNFGNTVSNIYGQQAGAIQNGADAASNAALLRGQANAGLGNTIGSALGGLASSFFQPIPYAAPAVASGGYNLGGGTSNYFASNPFGGVQY
jgi:hypothetical protein